MAISVTVLDQCFVHSISRSANCTNGASYSVGIGREQVAEATPDQLTLAGEPVHTSDDERGITTSRAIAGAALRAQSGNVEPVGVVLAGGTPVEMVRVTYSF